MSHIVKTKNGFLPLMAHAPLHHSENGKTFYARGLSFLPLVVKDAFLLTLFSPILFPSRLDRFAALF